MGCFIMLHKIYCDRFHEQNIYFNPGLSVVLGSKSGDNSIGKTTLMLIVDYVFGGETYSKSKDILENIHDHRICFTFRFKTRNYYFSRSFCNPNVVEKCDFLYRPIDKISLKEFNEWLSVRYELNYCKLTFRDAVSRYIRVYGKDNCDEKRPLNISGNEKASDAIISLLKLFNLYGNIDELERSAKVANEDLKIYQNAQKRDFIPKITKREFNKNTEQIEELTNKLNQFERTLNCALLDKDTLLSDHAIEVKSKLARTRRMRNLVKSKLKNLAFGLDCQSLSTSSAFSELKRFFPTVNIEHLEEIENFHREITKVFNDELEHEKKLLSEQLSNLNNEVLILENELNSLVSRPNISIEILNQFAGTKELIRKMVAQNSAYKKLEALKENKENTNSRLGKIKSEYLGEIEKKVNLKMEQLNDTLYAGLYTSPVLHLEENKYTFHTPNDTGTGIAYKGVVVFDLAILQLTDLPILVHDSIILKQISDEAIGNILAQYIKSGKQIVIALDKQSSYGGKTEQLLIENSIINLGSGGSELFGHSWSRKLPDSNKKHQRPLV